MKVKLFELRDRATFIPVMAASCGSDDLRERFLLRRAGYCVDDQPMIMLADLNGGRKAQYDPHAWGDRTFAVAHDYITRNWPMLTTGDVVDVEFILGETKEMKVTEAMDPPYGAMP